MRWRPQHSLFTITLLLMLGVGRDLDGYWHEPRGTWEPGVGTLIFFLLGSVAVISFTQLVKVSRVDLKYRAANSRQWLFPIAVVRRVTGHLEIHGRGHCKVDFCWLPLTPSETHRFKVRRLTASVTGTLQDDLSLGDNASRRVAPEYAWCEVVIERDGPWGMQICFEIATESNQEHRIGIAVRICGAVEELEMPADPVIEASGPSLGFPVVVLDDSVGGQPSLADQSH
jgi:hypothetical protein